MQIRLPSKISDLGTIDKIYPNQPGAYGFVMDEPAVLQFLPATTLSALESVTACRKDSQQITDLDR